jgi:hypothetical protein
MKKVQIPSHKRIRMVMTPPRMIRKRKTDCWPRWLLRCISDLQLWSELRKKRLGFLVLVLMKTLLEVVLMNLL